MATYNETPGAGFVILRMFIVTEIELPETVLLKKFGFFWRGGGGVFIDSFNR
jgi:hypothetical protein